MTTDMTKESTASRVLLPLRSNAAWFTSSETRLELERRLKTHLLLYDEVVVQNGRYECTVLDTGSFDRFLGPGAIEERSSIRYLKPGSEVSLAVAATSSGPYHPLLAGAPVAAYEVDFFPILHDAGLLDAPYIKAVNRDFPDEGRKAAKARADEDRRERDLVSHLSPNEFFAGKVLEGLYIDSAMANALDMPFIADPHVESAVAWKAAQAAKHWSADERSRTWTAWLSLGLPDWGSADWTHLRRVRESAAGRDFRRVVAEIAATAAKIVADGGDERAVDDAVKRSLFQQALAEQEQRRPTVGEAVVNFALNFIPFNIGAGVSGMNDVWKLVRERRSWVSLLQGPRARPQIVMRED